MVLHFNRVGYIKELAKWVSHELTVKILMNQISINDSLLKRNKIERNDYVRGKKDLVSMWKRSWTEEGETSQLIEMPRLSIESHLHLVELMDQLRIWHIEILWSWESANLNETFIPHRDKIPKVYFTPMMNNREAHAKYIIFMFHQIYCRIYTDVFHHYLKQKFLFPSQIRLLCIFFFSFRG